MLQSCVNSVLYQILHDLFIIDCIAASLWMFSCLLSSRMITFISPASSSSIFPDSWIMVVVNDFATGWLTDDVDLSKRKT